MKQLSLLEQKRPKQSERIQLRNYQKNAIAQVYGWYQQGKKSVCLVAPTGSGKTLMSSHIVKDAVSNGIRVLFIAHREPLIPQTRDTLINYGLLEHEIGFVKAGYRKEQGEAIVIASVQTLKNRKSPEGIGLVIFDEAHTTGFFSTSEWIIQHYAQAPIPALGQCKFLFLTATPFRSKKKEYFSFVDAYAFAPTIRDLIEWGYLAPPRHYSYGGIKNFASLSKNANGEFKQSEMAAECEDEEYNIDVVQKTVTYASDRPTIVFCASVKQATLITSLFNDQGLVAQYVVADTPQPEREFIYNRLRGGELNVLVGVGCFTEGFDVPVVSAIALARPTNSEALLIQMCGRGLRIAKGKKDCLLLDFGGNFRRLGKVEKKRKPHVCPNHKKGEIPTKSCPKCNAEIIVFAQICPECGYEFPRDDKADGIVEPPDFGEWLSPEELKRIYYVRSQRKMRFSKNLNPDGLWETWHKKFPSEILFNEWLIHSIFQARTNINEQRFLSYLQQFSSNPQWLRHHMAIEFMGVETRNNYEPPKLQQWWEIFDCYPFTTYEQVKEIYKTLISLEDDRDLFELYNWALEQVRRKMSSDS